MRMRLQSAPPLPARPAGVHEYRAALMSVALATDPRGDASALMETALRPVPLQEALKLIQVLPPEYQQKAKTQAAARMATPAYTAQEPARREEFRSHITELLGSDTWLQQLDSKLGGSPSKLPTLDQLQDAISAQSSSGTTASPNTPGVGGQTQPVDPLGAPKGAGSSPDAAPDIRPPIDGGPILIGGPILVPSSQFSIPKPSVAKKPKSTLDLTTLTTTVDVSSSSNLRFDTLVERLDPEKWSRSLFWPETYRVMQDNRTNEFVKDLTPKSALTPGWEGLFFEHVEWNWNLSTVSSFKNYLRIKYSVDLPKQRIALSFSLHSCQSSQLFALVNRGGVDIDWGAQSVSPGSPAKGGPLWELKTVKNIRFADLLERSTPYEGPAGSGQLLSYLAPAIVGLWMTDLLESLNT